MSVMCFEVCARIFQWNVCNNIKLTTADDETAVIVGSDKSLAIASVSYAGTRTDLFMHYAICSISIRRPILALLFQGVLKRLKTLLPESGGSCLNVRRTSSHETFWLKTLTFSKMLSRCAASVTSAIKHYLIQSTCFL